MPESTIPMSADTARELAAGLDSLFVANRERARRTAITTLKAAAAPRENDVLDAVNALASTMDSGGGAAAYLIERYPGLAHDIDRVTRFGDPPVDVYRRRDPALARAVAESWPGPAAPREPEDRTPLPVALADPTGVGARETEGGDPRVDVLARRLCVTVEGGRDEARAMLARLDSLATPAGPVTAADPDTADVLRGVLADIDTDAAQARTDGETERAVGLGNARARVQMALDAVRRQGKTSNETEE